MPETTYIVRLYTEDGFVEEYENWNRSIIEELFYTFSAMVPDDYKKVTLLSYDYSKHKETVILTKEGGH